MTKSRLLRSLASVNGLALGMAIGLPVAHLHKAYEAYRIRHRVVAGLEQAASATELVRNNLAAGWPANRGWVPLDAQDMRIDIDPSNGVVVLKFSEFEGGGSGKTLTLLPLYMDADDHYRLAVANGWRGAIKWVCTSAASPMAYAPSLSGYRGSMESKYAPADCRR